MLNRYELIIFDFIPNTVPVRSRQLLEPFIPADLYYLTNTSKYIYLFIYLIIIIIVIIIIIIIIIHFQRLNSLLIRAIKGF